MIEWNAQGISVAEADGRYVRRYVGATLVADTRSAPFSGGAEDFLWASSLRAGLPDDTAPDLLNGGPSIRALDNISVVNAGNTAVFSGVRVAGTLQAPAQPDVGAVTMAFRSLSYTGSGLHQSARLNFQTAEAHTPAAMGMRAVLGVIQLGSTNLRDVVEWTAPSLGVALWGPAAQSTLHILGASSSSALRNPADTANVIEWGADVLAFYNVAPVARQTILGSRGSGAALVDLLTKLALTGLIIDGTVA